MMVGRLRGRFLRDGRNCRFNAMTDGLKIARSSHLGSESGGKNQLNREKVGGCSTDYPFQQ